MSEREQAKLIIDQLSEYKVAGLLPFLRGLLFGDQMDDDAFCEHLVKEYEADPERDEAFTLEECKREWGLA